MPTLIDMDRPVFPFDHLTMAEAAFVQGLRVRYEDEYIRQHHARLCPMIPLHKLLGFFRRNAPPQRNVA